LLLVAIVPFAVAKNGDEFLKRLDAYAYLAFNMPLDYEATSVHDVVRASSEPCLEGEWAQQGRSPACLTAHLLLAVSVSGNYPVYLLSSQTLDAAAPVQQQGEQLINVQIWALWISVALGLAACFAVALFAGRQIAILTFMFVTFFVVAGFVIPAHFVPDLPAGLNVLRPYKLYLLIPVLIAIAIISRLIGRLAIAAEDVLLLERRSWLALTAFGAVLLILRILGETGILLEAIAAVAFVAAAVLLRLRSMLPMLTFLALIYCLWVGFDEYFTHYFHTPRYQTQLAAAILYCACIQRPHSKVGYFLPLCALFHVSSAAAVSILIVIAEAVVLLRERRLTPSMIGALAVIAIFFLQQIAGQNYSESASLYDLFEMQIRVPAEAVLSAVITPRIAAGFVLGLLLLGAAFYLVFRRSSSPDPAVARLLTLAAIFAPAYQILRASREQLDVGVFFDPLYYQLFSIPEYIGPFVSVVSVASALLFLSRTGSTGSEPAETGHTHAFGRRFETAIPKAIALFLLVASIKSVGQGGSVETVEDRVSSSWRFLSGHNEAVAPGWMCWVRKAYESENIVYFDAANATYSGLNSISFLRIRQALANDPEWWRTVEYKHIDPVESCPPSD